MQSQRVWFIKSVFLDSTKSRNLEDFKIHYNEFLKMKFRIEVARQKEFYHFSNDVFVDTWHVYDDF